MTKLEAKIKTIIDNQDLLISIRGLVEKLGIESTSENLRSIHDVTMGMVDRGDLILVDKFEQNVSPRYWFTTKHCYDACL